MKKRRTILKERLNNVNDNIGIHSQSTHGEVNKNAVNEDEINQMISPFTPCEILIDEIPFDEYDKQKFFSYIFLFSLQ